jgi:hypothetical protein
MLLVLWLSLKYLVLVKGGTWFMGYRLWGLVNENGGYINFNTA